MIPLIVLSGFLGSGKTTLLNRLLADPTMSGSAVIVNEIGDIGLDHELIVGGDDRHLLLSGGCVCCSLRGTVLETVASLLQRSGGPPRRIWLETSGVVDPVPLLAGLAMAPALAHRVAAQRLVTVVDATLAERTLRAHPEARRQVAVADSIVLGKSDIASPQATMAARRSARSLNPRATLLEPPAGPLPPSIMNEILYATAPFHAANLGSVTSASGENVHTDTGYVSSSMSFAGVLSREKLEDWLDEFLSCYTGRVLRLKGIVGVAGLAGPVVVHAVQHVLSVPQVLSAWPGNDTCSRLVVIAHQMDQSLLDDSLRTLAAAAELQP